MIRKESGMYRHMFKSLVPVLVAITLLLIGLWMRWPTVSYDGPPTPEAYSAFAEDRFAYSDIAMTYFRDDLADHPRPYFDYALEYPVGTGFLIYLLSTARTLPGYFLLTWACMTISALLILGALPRFPGGRVWLFAASPALALYVNLNWDMWGALLMVAALLLFVRERDGPAAAMLAAAVWTKFFPIVFVPLVVLDRLQRRGKRAAVRIVAIFTLGSVVINAPLLLFAPEAWWYFFRFNSVRPSEMNLWRFFSSWQLPTAEINLLSAALLVSGLVVLLILQWRSPPGAWLPACCAALAWFFFVSKVYSPQYSLWIVVLLAVVGVAPALAVAWSAVDLLYFAAHFTALGLLQYEDAYSWFAVHGLLPATALREGILLIVVGLFVVHMRVVAKSSVSGGRGEQRVSA